MDMLERHFSAPLLSPLWPARPPARRDRSADLSIGPDAASRFLFRKNLRAGSGSNLRKLQKSRRIAAGLRPLRFATR